MCKWLFVSFCVGHAMDWWPVHRLSPVSAGIGSSLPRPVMEQAMLMETPLDAVLFGNQGDESISVQYVKVCLQWQKTHCLLPVIALQCLNLPFVLFYNSKLTGVSFPHSSSGSCLFMCMFVFFYGSLRRGLDTLSSWLSYYPKLIFFFHVFPPPMFTHGLASQQTRVP